MGNNKTAFLLLVSAMALIAAGAAAGQSAEVFMKATQVCLECIGIG